MRVFGRRADFPSSVDTGSCVAPERVSNYVMGAAELDPTAAEELHVIGVGKGIRTESDGYPGGRVEVVVHKRPKPIVLALSTSSAVTWDVAIDANATVAAIVTQGNREQQILGAPVGVPITHLEDVYGCMQGWETWRQYGCNYWSTIREVRRLTELTEASFQGCSAGARFEIPHWVGDPPPCS